MSLGSSSLRESVIGLTRAARSRVRTRLASEGGPPSVSRAIDITPNNRTPATTTWRATVSRQDRRYEPTHMHSIGSYARRGCRGSTLRAARPRLSGQLGEHGDACLADAIGGVPTLEGSHHATSTPLRGTLGEEPREGRDVLELQREAAQRIAAQGVEAGGDENQIGDESLGGLIDGALELIDVALRRESRGQGDVPDVAQAVVIGGAAAWIPGPLVHRDEVDALIALDERLRPVPVVDVPVDDEHAVETVTATRVMGSDRHIAEEAEPHSAVAERVVAGRPDRAEAARGASVDGHVDGIQDAAGGRCCRIPGPFAGDGVGVERAAAGGDQLFDVADVNRVVRERELLRGGVSALDVLDGTEELGMVAECAGDGAQPADVLRVSPARVVAAAVGVRDEGDAHVRRASRPGHRTGRRRRCVRRKIDPSRAPTSVTLRRSSRTSRPLILITKSRASARGSRTARAATFTASTRSSGGATRRTTSHNSGSSTRRVSAAPLGVPNRMVSRRARSEVTKGAVIP